MKRFFLFLCLALAVSCGDSLSFPKWYCRNTDYPAFDVRDSLFSSSDSTSSDEPVKPRDNNIYLLTLEYPQGYDFLTDSLKGVVSGCYLKVYKNFALHRSIEVSDSNEVDSAEDNNYLIGGHLYSVYKGRENTLIKLDGESLFTLPAGHRVSGLIVIEGSVYTLSFSQGQWLLSRDGVPLRIGSGEIFHNLYDDCGDPCFAWKDGRDVYIYYNGKYERVEIGGNSVDDVCHLGSFGLMAVSDIESCPVAYAKANDAEKWEVYSFMDYIGVSFPGAYIIPSGEDSYFVMEMADEGHSNSGVVVFYQGSLDFMIDFTCTIPVFHSCSAPFITGKAKDGSVIAFSHNLYFEFPERFISPHGAIMFNDSRYFALAQNSPDTPITIYCEDEPIKVMEINGLPLAFSKD